MSETRAPYEVRQTEDTVYMAYRQEVIQKLLRFYSWEQLDALAIATQRSQDESGHGSIEIQFKDKHPRFIRRIVSQELPR